MLSVAKNRSGLLQVQVVIVGSGINLSPEDVSPFARPCMKLLWKLLVLVALGSGTRHRNGENRARWRPNCLMTIASKSR